MRQNTNTTFDQLFMISPSETESSNLAIVSQSNPLHISNFLNDGFVKFADVKLNPAKPDKWLYTDQHLSMYNHHFSWIYLIVLDDNVVKIGESGQPMAIPSNSGQPVSGTKCRMGRLSHHHQLSPVDTDTTIRHSLNPLISNGSKVSIYARRCPVIKHQLPTMGTYTTLNLTLHKGLELAYLQYCIKVSGDVPPLNKGLK